MKKKMNQTTTAPAPTLAEFQSQFPSNLTFIQQIQIEQLWESLYAKNQFPQAQTTKQIMSWLEERRKSYVVNTSVIGINALDKWHVEETTGNVYHESGKFFRIIGVKVDGAKGREVMGWTQPMVHQQECGILGILCKKFNGVRHYLLYAKYEPGNTDVLQLSPTLQATDSNLKMAHEGKKPLFAEYFEEQEKRKILTDVISVEDGGRFYMKTNRNIIVELDEHESITIPEDYIWVTYPQLRELLSKQVVVNSLTRSVMGSW